MRNPFALPILCILASLSGGNGLGQTVQEPLPVESGEAVKDFGFWSGDWLVLNTRYDIENGVFVDAGSARSSAEMLLGGRVLLERWEGVAGAIESSFGVTVRYFEPSRGRWVTFKSWPAGSPLAAEFSRIEGVFDEGVMVLHPARVFVGNFEVEQFLSTRSVVGDVAADAFRVQLQRPVLASSWAATWAMDYLRESPGQSGPLRIDQVPDAPATDAPEPRLADWMVGAWSAEGVSIRVSSALRGLGLIASVEVDRDDVRSSALLILAWDVKSGGWQVREVGLNRPLRSLAWETVGRLLPNGMVLRSSGNDDLGGMVFRRLEGDGMQFELTLPDGERVDVELSKL